MSDEPVEKTVHDVVRCAHESWGLLRQNQAAIRCAMVDPILWSLGWSTWLPRECQPEFSLGRHHRVDYALFDRYGQAVVFVQVRPLAARRHRDRVQLRETVRRVMQGVSVLTYGWEWEIYDLGCRARSFADRRVERLKLDSDAPHSGEQVADALYQWLGKDRWW